MPEKKSVMFCFLFRHNCNKPLFKNIFLVSSHSCPSPLVRAPPRLTLFPSHTTFHVCLTVKAKPTINYSYFITYSNTINSSGLWLDKSGYPITQWHQIVKNRLSHGSKIGKKKTSRLGKCC